MNIPIELQSSPAIIFVSSQGWEWKLSNSPNIELKACPLCKHDNFGHFYMEVRSINDQQAKRDGLWQCHFCGKGGNLYTLKQHLGIEIENLRSRKEWGSQTIEPMPNIQEAHEALLENLEAMDYLVNVRGFSREIIESQKLGLTKRYFKETGEVPALLIPYLVNGNCIFVHFRTLPPSPKSFNSLSGYDGVLYNGEILKEGIKELILFEGEFDTIAALDRGIVGCGVPGANFKKANWINTIDNLGIEKVYICYDNDKVGNKAAQSLATRIGIEKCYKISIPKFTITTENGTKEGKDLNEWMLNGGSKELFEQLKNDATLFDIEGVTGTKNALQELEDYLEEKGGIGPKYSTCWPSLNKLVGFDEGDVCDIIGEGKMGKSTFSLNLIEHMVDTYGDDALFLCLEMSTVRLARKWVSHVSGIEDNIPKTNEEAITLKTSFLEGIKLAKDKCNNREGDLLFCYPYFSTMDDLYKLIINVIRRYGVKWIVFDNIQLACDITLGGKNRTQHLSEISKTLAKIAKDYSVQMIRVVQPHQIKNGQMATANDADGSSQISKDCDSTIVIHRNRLNEISANDFETLGYVESESSFSDKMLVTVGLSRYSAGGYTTLHYDGARSTVSELSALQINNIKQEMERGLGHESAYQALKQTQEIQI